MTEHDSLFLSRYRLLLALVRDSARGGDRVKKLRTGDVTFTVFGWWIRLLWGVTMSPTRGKQRVRWHKFYGHRFFALRFGDALSEQGARLVGIQWRRVRDDA